MVRPDLDVKPCEYPAPHPSVVFSGPPFLSSDGAFKRDDPLCADRAHSSNTACIDAYAGDQLAAGGRSIDEVNLASLSPERVAQLRESFEQTDEDGCAPLASQSEQRSTSVAFSSPHQMARPACVQEWFH